MLAPHMHPLNRKHNLTFNFQLALLLDYGNIASFYLDIRDGSPGQPMFGAVLICNLGCSGCPKLTAPTPLASGCVAPGGTTALGYRPVGPNPP